MIPEHALVGLVTFGTHVHVHELGFSECPKAYVFRGTKEYSPTAVQEQLGLGSAGATRRCLRLWGHVWGMGIGRGAQSCAHQQVPCSPFIPRCPHTHPPRAAGL
jgi:hypothetical protein